MLRLPAAILSPSTTLCKLPPASQNRPLAHHPTGITAWQRGGFFAAKRHWIAASELWSLDSRLGIALEAGRNTVADGRLYTSEAVALKPGVGFVARMSPVPMA